MVLIFWSRNHAATVMAVSASNGRTSLPSTASRPGTVLTRCAGTMRSGFTQK